jgi:putative tributyrin esterase
VVKVVEETLQSSLTKRELPYRVILPKNYETSKAYYPVLFLLHGLFGSCDNWLELTEIKRYLFDLELVVVLPEGYNKWYSDSATIIEDKFESSFISELISTIEKKYRVYKSRAKRAIAGLSMGGFGALKFALKRPDLFVFAGSMSGAFNAPQITADNPEQKWNDLMPSILEVFGKENSRTRTQNDLFKLIKEIPQEKISSIPYLYFDCGTEDSFLEVNRKLAELLRNKKIAFEYTELFGRHDWDYWNRQIQAILMKAAKEFDRAAD